LGYRIPLARISKAFVEAYPSPSIMTVTPSENVHLRAK